MATNTTYRPLRKKNVGEVVIDDLNANSTTDDSAGGKIYAVGAKAVRLQVTGVSGTHTTHVCKLQASVDGENFADTSSSVTGAGQVAITAPDAPYYRAKITTGEGSAATVKAYVAVTR